MKAIAIPLKENTLSPHFGTCTHFKFFVIESNAIVKEEVIATPPHQPDSIPIWLVGKGVSDVITAGIGLQAIKILTLQKVNVFAGVRSKDPTVLVQKFLDGILETNGNLCDH